jgi:hypothetical protein
MSDMAYWYYRHSTTPGQSSRRIRGHASFDKVFVLDNELDDSVNLVSDNNLFPLPDNDDSLL